jgi:type IV secretory pathway VirB9-like protein
MQDGERRSLGGGNGPPQSMEASMTDTIHEFRERAARELRAARQAKSEPERQTHQSIANAYKALAESEAWLEGRIRPIGDGMVFRRK